MFLKISQDLFYKHKTQKTYMVTAFAMSRFGASTLYIALCLDQKTEINTKFIYITTDKVHFQYIYKYLKFIYNVLSEGDLNENELFHRQPRTQCSLLTNSFLRCSNHPFQRSKSRPF